MVFISVLIFTVTPTYVLNTSSRINVSYDIHIPKRTIPYVTLPQLNIPYLTASHRTDGASEKTLGGMHFSKKIQWRRQQVRLKRLK